MTQSPETQSSAKQFPSLLESTTSADADLMPALVDALLAHLVEHRASDVHIEPTQNEVLLRWRIDGVLQPLGTLPKELGPNVVARLKVLSGLLTYDTAHPQEGRIRSQDSNVFQSHFQDHEFRVSTFPALFGENVVIRVLAGHAGSLQRIADLGLDAQVQQRLGQQLQATSGAIIVTGPAGSGKTTTAYACLREIIQSTAGGRSIASLEDPVEAVVPGAVQSQVNPAAGFEMAAGLRSLLRQDPEVILIGEIRDRETAEIALQAALTGQLVVTTFHAGSCAEAVHRLIDMGLSSYAIRNAVRLIVSQRLLRKLCDCATAGDPANDALPLGIEVSTCRVPAGCETCRQTGYQGRTLIAETLSLREAEIQRALSESSSVADIESLARTAGQGDLRDCSWRLVEAGITSAAEVARVLGMFGGSQPG